MCEYIHRLSTPKSEFTRVKKLNNIKIVMVTVCSGGVGAGLQVVSINPELMIRLDK